MSRYWKKPISLFVSVCLLITLVGFPAISHAEPDSKPMGIELSNENILLAVGEQHTLSYLLTPEYAEPIAVEWLTSDSEIVTVENGIVTAMAVGTADISVRSVNDETIAALCIVEIIDRFEPTQALSALLANSERKISAGGAYSMAVMKDGSLWAWGNNYYGQLGDGTRGQPGYNNYSTSPKKVMSDVIYVSTGNAHSMALKQDGTLWAWGSGAAGQLGFDNANDILTPTKIMENVSSVSSGMNYTMAIKQDGTLWAWGLNTHGQLGDGTTIDRKKPVEIMKNVVYVSAGAYLAVAIKKDGSLWTWGTRKSVTVSTPTKVMDEVIYASAGTSHVMAIKQDGTLWAWGSNSFGQLGDETTTDKESPVQIMNDVVSVSAGVHSTLAVKKDGSLWGWGYNLRGQLGKADTATATSPEMIMNNVIEVSICGATNSGDQHTMIQKKDGSLWTCGSNEWGQLGIGGDRDSKLNSHPEFTEIWNAGTIHGFDDGRIPASFPTRIHTRLNGDLFGKKSEYFPILWDDSLFNDVASVYNHDLARLCVLLASAAYSNKEDAPNKYIYESLENLQFEDILTTNYAEDKNTVAFNLGHKVITCDSIDYDLIIVVIRGTLGIEWYGNFDIGNGETHAGFEKATNNLLDQLADYIYELESTAKLDKNRSKKFLITGHSRGAAVANLLAKDLTVGEKLSLAQKDNIYAYTFASPKVTTLAKGTAYNNIFNFFHYDDFVPVLPLYSWDYYWYGKNVKFPYTDRLYEKMETKFKEYTGVKFDPYNDPVAIDSFESNLNSLAPTVHDYYNTKKNYDYYGSREITPEYYFTNYVCDLLAHNSKWAQIAIIDNSTKLGSPFQPISSFFIGYGRDYFGGTELHYSHTPETYIAWLMALDSNWLEISYPNLAKQLEIACPVDVYIYDEDGGLIGSVVDNVINTDYDNPANISLTDGGTKEIKLFAYKDYLIEIIATGDGIMTYTISNIDIDSDSTMNSVCFRNVQLISGETFISSVSSSIFDEHTKDNYFDVSLLNTTTNDTKEVNSNGEGNQIEKYSVIAYTKGGGNVTGGGIVNKGDNIILEAFPNEGYIFTGWYENDIIINTENRYSLLNLNSNRKFEAQFTNSSQVTDGDNNGIDSNNHNSDANGADNNEEFLVSGTVYVDNNTFTVDINALPSDNASEGINKKLYRVIARQLNVRYGPSTDTNIISRLPMNSIVEILETTSSGWGRIKLDDGAIGWISVIYLIPINPSINIGNHITTANLKVRLGPSTNYKTFALLPKNTTIKVIRISENGFVEIKHGKASGYVYSAYLKMK